jgi:hypothetical protein
LLSGSAPGQEHVGGIVLADLVREIGAEHLVCGWLAKAADSSPPPVPGLKTVRIDVRYEHGFRPVKGFVGEVISALALRSLRPGVVCAAARRIQETMARTSPGLLLLVLDSPAAIQAGAAVCRRTGLPVAAMIWDDVQHLTRNFGLDRWTSRRVAREFADILRRCQNVAVMCENMQRAYAERYGVRSFVLRHGVRIESREFADRPAGDPWRLGFAGSITARDSFQTLISSLDRIGWRIDGRPVVLRLIGARYLLESTGPQRIEYLGRLSTVEETRQRLAECDLLFLPQPFDAGREALCRYSFPSKLSLYVAAGRPVVLHAPDYSSVGQFWSQHALGPWCKTLDAAALADTIQTGLCGWPALQSAWAQEVRNVHEHELSADRFAEGIRRLCRVEP